MYCQKEPRRAARACVRPSTMQTAVAYPLAFGHWQVHRDRLVCRMPRKTVSVQAPGALLREVLALCDGRLAWREVAAQLGRRWDAACVEGFLGQLSQQGAIVEAGEALACWSEIGQLPRMHPPPAPPTEWPQLAQATQARLLPGAGLGLQQAPAQAQALAAVLRQRQSRRTFADTPLDAAALADTLWAAHGVTGMAAGAAPHARRTVASGGGMHSMRWLVFVLRPLPGSEGTPLQTGVYEARFHLEGGCSFDPLLAGADAAWDLLQEPRVLTYASAIVLPVHEAALPARKYGNRGTLFGAVEAGQSLQNAQLMAEALGAAAVVRGDLRADVAMRLLAPCLHEAGERSPRWVVMPALVLGSRALPQQEESAGGDSWITLGPAVRLGGSGGFAFAGSLRVGQEEMRVGGRGADPRLALRKAEAEAWERRGWGELGACKQARGDELADAIDPRRLVAYGRHQYARPDFPLKPFDPTAAYLWRRGTDVLAGREVWVLAECVHALGALPPEHRAMAYTNTSTSGMAAWTDPEGALCRAAIELVERDAFLRAWLPHRPIPLVDPDTLPAAARRRVASLEAAGHRVAVAQLGDGLVPAHAVFLQGTGYAFTAITAAADFDAEQALAKALDEAEGRVANAAAMPARSLASARQVRSTEDIQRFYRSPRFFRRSDFFAAGAACERFGQSQHRFCSDWRALQARFVQRGLQLIAVDLTPPGAAVAQGRVPLHVVRAVLPGLLPIWFQHGLHPAAMPAFRAACCAGAACAPSPTFFVHPFT